MKAKPTKCCQWIKTLVGMEESAEAVIWRCSVNKVFRKIGQNSQKIHVLESLFNEVSGLETFSVVKKLLQQRQRRSPLSFAKF